MFTFNTVHDHFTYHVYDLATLNDILLGLLDDETDAKRITDIAGCMKFGDTFSNSEIYLKCKLEKEN